MNAPQERVRCAACSFENAIDGPLWAEMLAMAAQRAAGVLPGEESPFVIMRAEGTLHCTCRAGAPCCDACAAPLPLAEASDGADRTFACTGCGGALYTWPAPAWLQSGWGTPEPIGAGLDGLSGPDGPRFDQRPRGVVQRVIATQPDETRRPPGIDPGAREAELAEGDDLGRLRCPSCGAAVRLANDATRLVGCEFCKSQLFVSNAIWQRLHPVTTVRPFWFKVVTPPAPPVYRPPPPRLSAAPPA